MSEEQDPEIQEKQNYLRQNIMDAGYDTNSFVEFLVNKKGEAGADVSNWSFPDLKNVVNEFISLNNPNKDQQEEEKDENNDNTNQNKAEEKKESIENKEIKEEKKEPIKAPIKEKSEECNYGIITKNEMQCLKVQNNEISNSDNIKITVGSFEKVEGGIFSKSYVSYLVTTMPFNWNVRRRFSDFEWLRQTLINHYNYCLIPFVPKKPKNLNKIVGDRFDKDFLSKRSRNFEKFLNYIIIDPILRNTQLIYDFLNLEKEDEFQKMKKAFDKLKVSTFNISKILTVDGKATIEINEDKEKYFNDIKETSTQNENILKKINATIKALKEDLNNASDKLIDISNNFNLIKENAINYKENEDVISAYKEMSDMFSNFSSYLTNQNNIININLREYFKYIKNNYRAMKDFVRKTENLKNAFYKSLKNLKAKKEDLFRRQEVAKWDIDPKDNVDKTTIASNKNLALEKMLYKETLQVTYQKVVYGFFINRIILEHERFKEINSNLHYKNSMDIIDMMTNKTTEFITSLADNTTGLTHEGSKKQENEGNNEENVENVDNNENA